MLDQLEIVILYHLPYKMDVEFGKKDFTELHCLKFLSSKSNVLRPFKTVLLVDQVTNLNVTLVEMVLSKIKVIVLHAQMENSLIKLLGLVTHVIPLVIRVLKTPKNVQLVLLEEF